MTSLVVRQLEGLQEYQKVCDAMHQFTDARSDETADELWFLEHEPVFTQGQAGKAEHLLATGDIPVVQTDRGGQVTYHGPGQLVVYCLLDLSRRGVGPRRLVTDIEQAIVSLLSQYDLDAYPKQDAPGVYVNEQKIASLGLRIRKGKSFHGLALNLDMDLSPFLRINPCGYAGMQMTQLKDYHDSIDFDEVLEKLRHCLQSQLGYSTVEMKTGLPPKV
ncbi:lipoyl(octanoyl) transferase LipB [Litoribrevibacter euphylliae]|uniref:Octanoyltransferase n=1 Tax=Litoribrevibacter euphylliae TaxID=1834034 RepID=A0ABV7HLY8_9GAMM